MKDPVELRRSLSLLGPTERQIMGLLWDLSDPIPISLLTRSINRIQDSGRARTTYQTVLDRLVIKGLVVRETVKNVGYFSAACTKEQLIKELSEDIRSV